VKELIRVLFVDDDVALQNVYKAIFPINSIDIIGQAFDGAEAVKTVEKGAEFDVIVMDQRMPVMDGVTATKKILEKNGDIRILFLSADEGSRDAALAAGARSFLIKPVKLDVLMGEISKIAAS